MNKFIKFCDNNKVLAAGVTWFGLMPMLMLNTREEHPKLTFVSAMGWTICSVSCIYTAIQQRKKKEAETDINIEEFINKLNEIKKAMDLKEEKTK